MSSLASYKGLSPAMAERSSSFYSQSKYNIYAPTTPRLHCYKRGLGFSPFARHY